MSFTNLNRKLRNKGTVYKIFVPGSGWVGENSEDFVEEIDQARVWRSLGALKNSQLWERLGSQMEKATVWEMEYELVGKSSRPFSCYVAKKG